MNLKQLEYFVRVAELSSFSRAALQLGLPQPALSRHIRQLELELRQTLLLRNGRGATPTEAGKLLMSHARGILHQVALATEGMDQSRGQLSGRVAVGLPPSLSRKITVPFIQSMQQQLPLAKVTLTEGFSVLMHENLRLGNLDLALLYNPELTPDLEHSPVHQESLVLVSKAAADIESESLSGQLNGQIKLEAVCKLPLILPSRPNAFRLLLENATLSRKLKLNIAFEVDGLNAILSLVQAGMGHAILPSYTATQAPQGLQTRAIIDPVLMSKLVLVKSALRPSTQTQLVAAQILTSTVQKIL